jgi:hypothetical protein
MNKNGLRIELIGAGGIVSNLMTLLLPALRNGKVAKELGGITFHLHDADIIEQRNLIHQRFTEDQVGLSKVKALERRFDQIHSSVRVIGHEKNLRDIGPLLDADIVLVAVDRPEPRRIVHSLDQIEWYDLRCGLDSCLVLTHTTHPDDVERLTTDHRPASCQPDEAIETGNVQFGFALAATYGANILLRSMMRRIDGKTIVPGPVCYSMRMGPQPVFLQTNGVVPSKEMPPKRPTIRWSGIEDDELLNQAKLGLPLERVAKHHDRSPGAIWHRLLRISGIRDTQDVEVGE